METHPRQLSVSANSLPPIKTHYGQPAHAVLWPKSPAVKRERESIPVFLKFWVELFALEKVHWRPGTRRSRGASLGERFPPLLHAFLRVPFPICLALFFGLLVIRVEPLLLLAPDTLDNDQSQDHHSQEAPHSGPHNHGHSGVPLWGLCGEKPSIRQGAALGIYSQYWQERPLDPRGRFPFPENWKKATLGKRRALCVPKWVSGVFQEGEQARRERCGTTA